MAQGYKAQGNGTQIQIRPGINTSPVQEPELLAITVSWEQFTIFQPSSTHSNYSKYLVKLLWNFVIGRLCNLLLSFEYLQDKDLFWDYIINKDILYREKRKKSGPREAESRERSR